MTAIIANGFGVLSTLCFIISYQVKSNKRLFVVQSVATGFYGIQFLLLGAYGGLFNMVMQIVRNILLLKINEWKWLKHPVVAPLFCVPSLIYMIFTWNGFTDFLPFLAFTVGTLTFWTNNAKVLRLGEIVCVVPAWLTYDLISRAYGGVLTELIIASSVVASIIRFGWSGLDKLNDPKEEKDQ